MAKKSRKDLDVFEILDKDDAAKAIADEIHIYHNGAVCETDSIGYATPEGRSPLEIVVDASEGFIPLWEENTTLRWRFNELSMAIFADPEEAKSGIRNLFAEGIQEWKDSPPVKFSERHDAWDFEIAVAPQENCTINGCTLARAFFPDSGRHDLLIYPTMFKQSRKEMVETLAHEIGHIFGLRHFFANISEEDWPVEIFGAHNDVSIMNYGPKSRMTKNDRDDLKTLYQLVWSGQLKDINGTPIRLMRPFSFFRAIPQGPFHMV